MNFNQIRSTVSQIAGYAALACGAILALKLLRLQVPISGDVSFWVACCVAAMALR